MTDVKVDAISLQKPCREHLANWSAEQEMAEAVRIAKERVARLEAASS